jgi:hypothetical protein
MSQILKGLLEPEIRRVVKGFGTGEYTGPNNPITAQDRFVSELSQAIAIAVQKYLISNVLVIPGIPVATVGGPTAQAGATVAPGRLNAP